VRTLIARDAGCRIYLAGVSLGGNVLGKWLGEQGEGIPAQVKGAALLSPPFRPDVAAPAFHEVLGGFYVWHFMRTLRPKGLAKAGQFPDRLDAEAIRRSRDFYDYDTVVTARLHGFRDAEDYWRKVACAQYLPAVRVPTLLLTSADDPFNPASTIPRDIADASPWLHPLWTDHGGHVGFVTGPSPWSVRYWSEDQIVAFFRLYEGAAAR
jgi:predicted alpha/beta-fold hydrolase